MIDNRRYPTFLLKRIKTQESEPPQNPVRFTRRNVRRFARGAFADAASEGSGGAASHRAHDVRVCKGHASIGRRVVSLLGIALGRCPARDASIPCNREVDTDDVRHVRYEAHRFFPAAARVPFERAAPVVRIRVARRLRRRGRRCDARRLHDAAGPDERGRAPAR
ncbi:hypothetical protein, partial [Burkholderia thailandensis]